MSVKNQKTMSMLEAKISDFEIKIITMIRQSDKFDSVEQLIKQLEIDMNSFKGAAQNDFVKLKNKIKEMVEEINDTKLHNENQDREIDTLKKRKQTNLLQNEDLQSDMLRVSGNVREPIV